MYGGVYEAVVGYTLSIVRGFCYDSYGNVAEFKTYVGISPTDNEEDFPAGIGGVGLSVVDAITTVKADSVYDIAGKGCYLGGVIVLFFHLELMVFSLESI